MMETAKTFDARLESLRGIAALAVAWGHANSVFLGSGSFPARDIFDYWTFQAFPAGAAVVLFFVLSGFVLGGALQRESNIFRYFLRRIFRIFPALWLGVSMTYALQLIFASTFDHKLVTDWFINVFLMPQTVADLFRNLVLAKRSIDPVIWSLIPEVVCSFLLPALVWLHQRTQWAGRSTILICLAIIGHYAGSEAMQYLVAFYVGFSLPAEVVAPQLSNRWRSLGGALVGWLLLCIGNTYGVPYTSNMREACTAGAVILIGALVSAPHSFAFLNVRPLRFFGRISFSFYLLHLPSLFFICAIAQSVVGSRPTTSPEAMVIAVLSIFMTAIAAALAHRFVELPGIQLGKRVTRRLGGLVYFNLSEPTERAANAHSG